MPDRENVIRELRDIDLFITRRLEYEKAKKFLRTIDETIILLKDQEGTINELQNAYGYLQKQFFEAQEKLLKEQEHEVCENCPYKLEDIGDFSDGYHTFNDLYYQRCVLFATIVNMNKSKAWKTRYHEDGEPCFGGGWFLVTVDTPEGPYGYHYEDKYWDMFDCKELEIAKPWDGYTEEDVHRLFSLEKHGEWKTIWDKNDPDTSSEARCSVCGRVSERPLGYYCKWCGSTMDKEC